MEPKKPRRSKLREKFEAHMNEKLSDKGYIYLDGKYVRVVPDVAVVLIEPEYPRGQGRIVSIRVGITPLCSGIRKELDLFSYRITTITSFRGGIVEPELLNLPRDEQMRILLEEFDALFNEINSLQSPRDIYNYYSGPDFYDKLYYKYLLCVQMGDWARAQYHLERCMEATQYGIHCQTTAHDAIKEIARATHWASKRTWQRILESYDLVLNKLIENYQNLQTKYGQLQAKEYALLLDEVNENIAASKEYCDKLLAGHPQR